MLRLWEWPWSEDGVLAGVFVAGDFPATGFFIEVAGRGEGVTWEGVVFLGVETAGAFVAIAADFRRLLPAHAQSKRPPAVPAGGELEAMLQKNAIQTCVDVEERAREK